MTRKSVLRSVRLDDDVWEAIKAMDGSLNQYLRGLLVNGKVDTDVRFVVPDKEVRSPPSADLDAVGPELASGRGKASAEAFKRGPRPKGDPRR